VSLTFGTALDLFANQSHQNPFVPASEWLAPPATLDGIDRTAARVYAPLHNEFHMLAFRLARGWSDLDPYRVLRATIAPNTGVYWGISSADCYAGISPGWFVDVWGDHSRAGILVPPLMRAGESTVQTHPALVNVLATYGVTHVISPTPIVNAQLYELKNEAGVHLYQVPGKRIRVAANARAVESNREAASVLISPDFDPSRTVVLHTKKSAYLPDEAPPLLDDRSTATIAYEESTRLRIQVNAPRGGYLLVADTYYPGWRATVDGTVAKVFRANISSRAVRLPPGSRTVEFNYDAASFFQGIKLACVGGSLLVVWQFLVWLAMSRRRSMTPPCAQQSC
jgi:hypothetical protein